MTEAPSPPLPDVDDRPPRRSGWWVVAVAALVVVAVAVGFVSTTDGGRGDGSANGDGSGDDHLSSPALSVPLTTAAGGSATLSQFTGRPMVVNFFASWCPPCRAEMPELEQVHLDRGDDVRLVGVSVDYDTTTWKSLVAEAGITFETVFEPTQDLLRAVGGKGMPTTVLVDGDGRIVHVHTGPLDAGGLERLIDDRLAVQGSP